MCFKKKNLILAVIILIVCSVMTILIISSFAEVERAYGSDSVNNSGAKIMSDVSENDWYCDDVEYVSKKGLMEGTGAGIFSPSAQTTRAMIVTILWRLDGSPAESKAEFSDVNQNDYFYNAVAWGAANNIVSGYSADKFAPDDNATREQLTAIIYRYALFKKYDMTGLSVLDAYADKNSVSGYAVDVFKWAIANKIITGTSNDMLSPQDFVQRSQVAAILHRFCVQFANENISKTDTNHENTATDTSVPSNENKGHNNNTSIGGSSGKGSDSDSQNNNGAVTISADNVFAGPGDNVQVVVRVNNNPGILGMTLAAYFDDVNLNLMSVENGSAFKDILELTPSKVLENGVKFLWDGIELKEEDVHNGDILIMNFKVSESATNGKYPITLKSFEDDIVDKDLKSISPEIINGYITVSD